MVDPRHVKALLKLAKEHSGSFQELSLETGDGLKLHVKFTGQEQEQPKQAQPQKLTRAELELEAKKRATKEVRPALDSLAEKPPLFDWGLKS